MQLCQIANSIMNEGLLPPMLPYASILNSNRQEVKEEILAAGIELTEKGKLLNADDRPFAGNIFGQRDSCHPRPTNFLHV